MVFIRSGHSVSNGFEDAVGDGVGLNSEAPIPPARLAEGVLFTNAQRTAGKKPGLKTESLLKRLHFSLGDISNNQTAHSDAESLMMSDW